MGVVLINCTETRSRPVKKLLLLSLLALGSSCQTDADLRPATYDELAMGTGHWEWVSTAYMSGLHTPTTEGYTRELLFGASNQLTLRRSGQPDYRTTYQFAMGKLTYCGPNMPSVPTISYDTNEKGLYNNERKTYSVSQQGSRQMLSITGEAACMDGGAYETYYWVAE